MLINISWLATWSWDEGWIYLFIPAFRFCYAPYQVLKRYGIKGPTPLPVIGNYFQMAKRVILSDIEALWNYATTVSLGTKSAVLLLLIQDIWTYIWVSWIAVHNWARSHSDSATAFTWEKPLGYSCLILNWLSRSWWKTLTLSWIAWWAIPIGGNAHPPPNF